MQRIKNILYVATSGSVSDAALEQAVALAGNNQASLTVVGVIDKIPANLNLKTRVLSPEDYLAYIVEVHLNELQELVSPWKSNAVEIQAKVLIGISFLSVIREVLRNGHDLVIKTAENGGLLDRVFGSDDMHLLRKCPCPVWLVKSGSPKAYHRMMAAVDADDMYAPKELNTRHQLNLQILEMASSLALSNFSELHIVYAWFDFSEASMRGFARTPEDEIIAYVEEVRQHHEQKFKALIDKVINKLGQDVLEYLKPQTHLLKGLPLNEIPALASKINIDLVVMGTLSRTGISGIFMGNTAETILNQLNCSLRAIKPPGFISPITLED
ncbi:MAG: universal stress protein [Proteobacteria bacterium]|nr:universal stress protein [Pseudomonadota bacterium]